METLLFAMERAEREIGFGVWALRSVSLVPSLILFIGSAALFLVGSYQLKKSLKKLRAWDLEASTGYTRTARRFGGYYKIGTLLLLQSLWLYSLIASFFSVLTADPF